jgi:cell division protein FtsI (penicillin-binding protein 3)
VNAPTALRIDRAERVELREAAATANPLGIAQQRLMGLMLLFMLICLFGAPDDRTAAVGTAERGEILDRNGQPLATTIKLWAVAVNPQKILGDKNALAVKLNQLMPEKSVDDYRRILFGKRKFLYLRQPAPPELAAAVHALGEPGMLLLSEPHRLFPQGAMAGHLLGYSQEVEDGHGHSGITGIGVERFFNDALAQGKSIQLAMDTRVQAAVENEIQRRMTETQAKGGAGIVLDVDTGEVLAMASLPDINPNAPFKGVDPSDQQVMINKATQAVYELGSTFKMITFANAIEHGVITDWSKTYDVTAPLQVGRFRIKDDEPKKRPITTVEIMTFSSNIGTSQIALALGAQNIDAFFKTLGLDKRTDIELRERGQPQYPTQWGQSAVMTTSFGHGIAVTPLHLARIFAALTNGGVMHPVTLLKRQPGAQIPGQRVVSEATSARIRQLMRLVVLQGTGTNANAPGLRVGGKTGTAEKVNQFGGYDRNANITVFAGAFPMDHPRYVTLVVLDDARPTKETYGFKTAGWMAAPVGKRIIARIGPLLGVRPDLAQDIDVSDLMPLILEKKDPSKNVVE